MARKGPKYVAGMVDYSLLLLKLTIQCQPRCNVQTFICSHAADVGALYGCECIYGYFAQNTQPSSQ
jgi:hypothetical protein